MPRSNPQNTVKALRAEAKAAYARGKGNRALKGYNKMPKHAERKTYVYLVNLHLNSCLPQSTRGVFKG